MNYQSSSAQPELVDAKSCPRDFNSDGAAEPPFAAVEDEQQETLKDGADSTLPFAPSQLLDFLEKAAQFEPSVFQSLYDGWYAEHAGKFTAFVTRNKEQLLLAVKLFEQRSASSCLAQPPVQPQAQRPRTQRQKGRGKQSA